MFRTLKAPVTMQIEVTERCDNTCRHCYNFFRHQGYKYKTLSSKQIEIIVEEMRKYQVVHGVVTGGEPLTVPDLTIYLIEELRTAGIRIMFNSNLTLFSRKLGERLKSAGVTSIMTSLIADQPNLHDYVTQQAGSWKKTTTNIKLAVEMGFRVMVNMVLTRWNCHRVRETGDLIGSWGVSKFGATRACSPGPIASCFAKNLITVEELRTSLQIMSELQDKWGYQIDVFEHYPWCALSDVKKYQYLARRKCTAGVTSASIGADGQLRPCGHSSLTYGDVLQEGLQTPWLRMTAWREQQYTAKCRDCRHYRSCTGGCAVDALNSEAGADHHMTCEADVLTVPDEISLPPVQADTFFQVIPNIILREESFGGTVAAMQAGTVYVDKKTLGILKALRGRDSFTANGVATEFQVEVEPTREVLARLEFQHLIKKGGMLQ